MHPLFDRLGTSGLHELDALKAAEVADHQEHLGRLEAISKAVEGTVKRLEGTYVLNSSREKYHAAIFHYLPFNDAGIKAKVLSVDPELGAILDSKTHPYNPEDTTQIEKAFLRDELEAKCTWGRDMFSTLRLQDEGYTYEHLTQVSRQALSYLGYHMENRLIQKPSDSGLIGAAKDTLYISDTDRQYLQDLKDYIVFVEGTFAADRQAAVKNAGSPLEAAQNLAQDDLSSIASGTFGHSATPSHALKITLPTSVDAADIKADSQKQALEAVSKGTFLNYTDLYKATLDKMLAPSEEAVKAIAARANAHLGIAETSYTGLKEKLEEKVGVKVQADRFKKLQEKRTLDPLLAQLTQGLEKPTKQKEKYLELLKKAGEEQKYYALETTTLERYREDEKKYSDSTTGSIVLKEKEVADKKDELAKARTTLAGGTKGAQQLVNQLTKELHVLEGQLSKLQQEQRVLQSKVRDAEDVSKKREITFQGISEELNKEFGRTWPSVTNAWKEALPLHSDFVPDVSALASALALTDPTVSGVTFDDLKKFQTTWTARQAQLDKEIGSTTDPDEAEAKELLEELKKVGAPTEEQTKLKEQFNKYISAYQTLMHRRVSRTQEGVFGARAKNEEVGHFLEEFEVLTEAENILKELNVKPEDFYKELNQDPNHSQALGLYTYVWQTMVCVRTTGLNAADLKQHRTNTDVRMQFLFEHRDAIEEVFANYLPRTIEHAKARLWFRHNVSAQGSQKLEEAGESLSDQQLDQEARKLLQLSNAERVLQYGAASEYKRRLPKNWDKEPSKVLDGLRAFAEWEGHGKIGGAVGASIGYLLGGGLKLGSRLTGTVLDKGGAYLIERPAGALAKFLSRRQNRFLRWSAWIPKLLEFTGDKIHDAGEGINRHVTTRINHKKTRDWIRFIGQYTGMYVPRVGSLVGYGADRYGIQDDFGRMSAGQHQPGTVFAKETVKDFRKLGAVGGEGSTDTVSEVLAEIRAKKNGKGLYADKVKERMEEKDQDKDKD